jgi:hypothetical protein
VRLCVRKGGETAYMPVVVYLDSGSDAIQLSRLLCEYFGSPTIIDELCFEASQVADAAAIAGRQSVLDFETRLGPGVVWH